ncbi:hypothetical protein OESDEN_03202, partial [Oesophagostomum dentatum]
MGLLRVPFCAVPVHANMQSMRSDIQGQRTATKAPKAKAKRIELLLRMLLLFIIMGIINSLFL